MADGIAVRVRKFKDYLGRADTKQHLWFRCSNRILEDEDFESFSDAELCVWIYILSLCSQKKSDTVFINFDRAERFAKRKRKDILSAIDRLQEKQIELVTSPVAHAIRTDRVQNPYSTNKQTNKHIRESGDSLPALILSWNDEIKNLAKVIKLNPKRKSVIEKHEREYDDAGWRAIFRRADGSNFLVGGGARGWRATFDWVLKNASRIEEGEFDRPQPEVGAGSMRGA